MEQDDLVKRVVAMMEQRQQITDALKKIKTPEKLTEVLELLKPDTEKSLRFLKIAKEEGIFKEHMHIKGMLDIWRSWARERGIKEGDFLFEN